MQIAMEFFFCRSFLIFAVENSGKKFYATGAQASWLSLTLNFVSFFSKRSPIEHFKLLLEENDKIA